MRSQNDIHTDVAIPVGDISLNGELIVPAGVTGIVLFAHGSGSSRHSPRNKFVARMIRDAGLGTLLFDLLTADEEIVDAATRHLRFNIALLATRLAEAARWLKTLDGVGDLNIGFFGASTGGAAALVAAAELRDDVGAVVSRGGRPDLAGAALAQVRAPVLLLVGGLDRVVIELNQRAYELLKCEKELKIVPGASHLFEEPGTLETVGRAAAEWFRRFLVSF